MKNSKWMVRASSKAIVAAALISAFPAAASVADAQKNNGVSEVVVTASRRAVNLQKESRAVVAVGSEALISNGVSEPTAVQNLVPGLSMASNGQQVQVFIRGIGDRTITAATDPAVSLNIDGVYHPRSYQIRASIYDLERVEVLKGPQGTLYGRNSSAGAVNFITAKPKMRNEGFIEVEAGNFNQMRATGAANFQLGETAAFRLAGQVSRHDGYLSDGYNDEDMYGVRGQFLWRPTDVDSLLVSVSHNHLGGKGDAGVIAKVGPGGGFFATSADQAFHGSVWDGPSSASVRDFVARRNGQDAADRIADNGFIDDTTTSISLDYSHDFSFGTLSILPSRIESHAKTLAYVTIAVPDYQDAESVQNLLEVRLSSPNSSRNKWVVGAFAAKEEVNSFLQSLSGGGLFSAFEPTRDDSTWALYGEGNFLLTDKLHLIVGARYTYEKKELDGYLHTTGPGFTQAMVGTLPNYTLPLPYNPLTPALTPSLLDQREDKATNYRLGVEYELTDDVMLYANVSSGFKAGGLYDDSKPNSFAPEKLTAYQAGIKSRLFDNRLQFNVEGFYWDYKDQQQTFLGVANFGGFVLVTKNAGAVTLYGLDASATWRATDNDTFTADISYLNSNYDEYTYTAFSFFGPPSTGCKSTPTGPISYQLDCSGLPLARSPEWTGRVSYSHTQSLGTNGDLVFNIGTRFSSEYFVTNDFTPVELVDGYTTSDASLTWNMASGRSSVTAFVKNIEDEAIFVGGNQVDLTVHNTMTGNVAPPRTYGLRVRVSY